MELVRTIFDKAMLLKHSARTDLRGPMQIMFREGEPEEMGIDFAVRDCRVYTMPEPGTFFGIHYQSDENPMAKMISVIRGKGMDYIIDLRPDSPTFLQWEQYELSSENNLTAYIPQGFGHAFISLEEDTIQLYTADACSRKGSSRQLNYREEKIGLRLPVTVSRISAYDDEAPYLND